MRASGGFMIITVSMKKTNHNVWRQRWQEAVAARTVTSSVGTQTAYLHHHSEKKKVAAFATAHRFCCRWWLGATWCNTPGLRCCVELDRASYQKDTLALFGEKMHRSLFPTVITMSQSCESSHQRWFTLTSKAHNTWDEFNQWRDVFIVPTFTKAWF